MNISAGLLLFENNFNFHYPVPAQEDHTKSIVTQELSENTCQRIMNSDVTSSPSSNEQQQLESSQDTSKGDIQATDSEQVSSIQSSNILVSEIQLEIQAEENPTVSEILDTQQTDVIASKSEVETAQQVESASETPSVTALVESSVPVTPSENKPVESSEKVTSQIVSEATTECPVPIQVAESVLQAEPKESVSEDSRPVVEAVVSSITPSLSESAAVVSESPIEPQSSAPSTPPICPRQLNGDDPNLQLELERDASRVVTSTALMSRSPNVVSVVHEFDTRITQSEQAPREGQQLLSQAEPETVEKSLDETESKVSTDESDVAASQKTKLTVILPLTDKNEDVTDLQVQAENQQKSSIPVSSEAEEAPSRPTRSKDLKIPSTPIVIGPTPPTSPPLETEENKKEVESETAESTLEGSTKVEQTPTPAEVQVETQPEKSSKTQAECQPEKSLESQTEAQPEKPVESHETEKKSKKVVKKSSVESDTPSSPESEGSGKKLGKKIVKKVKPKESEAAEDGGSTEKPKKTKTIKKVAKTSSSTSLEADKSVPETPPPSVSSEVPVPPKRKSKSSSSAKAVDKKPDES